MDALELLKQDHRKVAELFKQVEATEDMKKHQQLFQQIKTELEAHTHIEEIILYPSFEKHEELKDITLEVIIAVGHTDSDGSDAMNQKLSVRRADAVKDYLTGKGVEKNRVYTEGKGEKQPVADNKTKEGKAKNRRVEIEVVGTRTKK